MEIRSERFEQAICKKASLGFLLVLPDGYQSTGAAWPLILFLHGAGERGSRLEDLKEHGLVRVAVRNPGLPFVVLAPQCPPDSLWDDHLDDVSALLDRTTASLNVDPDRVYLTGLSLGGYGAWYLACLQPKRFAALAPICGGGVTLRGFPARAAALAHLPIWAFHGALDPVVPVRESEVMVDAVRQAGGDAKLTVYSGAAHDAWTQAYNDPHLYEWFLKQRRH